MSTIAKDIKKMTVVGEMLSPNRNMGGLKYIVQEEGRKQSLNRFAENLQLLQSSMVRAAVIAPYTN